ncbi:hypothetical protein CCACVL1_06221, partial [Corchorus capsularis]
IFADAGADKDGRVNKEEWKACICASSYVLKITEGASKYFPG